MGSGGQNGEEDVTILPSPSRPVRQQHHHHHHGQSRRHFTMAQSRDAYSGVDQPPSITCPSQGHRPRRVQVRTAQFLCTLVHPYIMTADVGEESSVLAGLAPCAPIVAFGRYIISATNDGRVCFYSLQMKDMSDSVPPQMVVDLDRHSVIVGLVAAPTGVSLFCSNRSTRPSFVGHLIAVTSEGDVHLLECVENETRKLYSWNTGSCNISCLAVRPDRSGQWRLCVGYESGCLEEWQMSMPVQEDNVATEETPESANNIVPHLLFRASFDAPIRSLASLGCSKNRQSVDDDAINTMDTKNDKALPESIANCSVNDECSQTDTQKDYRSDISDFVAATLMINTDIDESSLDRPASSSQVEVLDAASLGREWLGLFEEEDAHGDRYRALSVEEYCVWPRAGMEIMDTASLRVNDHEGHRRLSRRIRGVPSRGSDCMCTHHGECPFFVAALSDGTLALMEASVDSNGSLEWGVVHDSDQVTLSFPAIGVAPVELSTGVHIACCLRGGTVFLVPKDNVLSPVTAILAPVDDLEEEEEPLSPHYLHGFCAGNVSVKGINFFPRDATLPVLVFSGPPGVLQVFSRELVSQTEEETLLRELLENGTVQLLGEMLCSLRDEDPLLILEIWNQSRQEFLGIEADVTSLRVNDLSSPSFAHTQRLLIQLAEQDKDR